MVLLLAELPKAYHIWSELLCICCLHCHRGTFMLLYVEDDGRDSCTLWLIVCVQGPRAEITDGCCVVVALVSLV